VGFPDPLQSGRVGLNAKLGIDLSPPTVVIAWMTRATMRADRAPV
jgi:hypothetical protein